jgi:hypothetical protein
LTDDERLALVGSLYVERDVADEVFGVIDHMRKRARVLTEPKSLMLIGDTGMGKTTLLKAYLEKNPSKLVDNCRVSPVVYVSIPVKTTIRGAATEILRVMEVPRYNKGNLDDRTHLVKSQLVAQKVEVILVDEMQHVVEASGAKSLPKVGDFFKDLSKKAKVPFVLTGMPATKEVVSQNDQLKRMCRLKNIGPFTAASGDEFLSFRRFLVKVDAQLPFSEQARLGDPDTARLIFAATQGKICHVMSLIREAAMLAIENGAHVVRMDHLSHAFDSQLDSVVPIDNNPFDPKYKDAELKKAKTKKAA